MYNLDPFTLDMHTFKQDNSRYRTCGYCYE